MDWIAFASVASSGLVAFATVVAGFWNARGQRRHEETLAYEERAWGHKTDALFEVIRSVRELPDAAQGFGPNVADLDEQVHKTWWELDRAFPEVEAFASAECRRRLHGLREWLRPHLYSVDEARLQHLRRQKEAAIDAADFDRAAAMRAEELELLRGTAADLTIDDAFVDLLDKLLVAARNSVRGRG